jgi:hypothetical protein
VSAPLATQGLPWLPPSDQSAAGGWRARAALLGLTAVFVAAAWWEPAAESGVILCPFRALTHHPCPGCGMTRAFCALAHGEFWRAVTLNPFSPLLFLAALVAWARAAAAVFRLGRLRRALDRLPRLTASASWALLALVAAWWAVRLALGL